MCPTRMRLGIALLVSCTIVVALAGSALSSADSEQSADMGSYVLADTWPIVADERPDDAWQQISGIDLDAATGDLYVADADPADPRVTVVRADGSASLLVSGRAGCNAQTAAEADLCAPAHLAVDAANDRLYVADRARAALLTYRLDGSWVRTHEGIPGALGVAVAPDGTVYVTASRTGDIHPFDKDGLSQAVWEAVVPRQAGGGLLAGLDVDEKHNVYVLDARTNQILIHNAVGTLARDHKGFAGDAKLLDIAALPYSGNGGRRAYWLATNQGLMYTQDRDVTLGVINPVGALTAVAGVRGGRLYASLAGYDSALSQVLDFDESSARTGLPERIGGLLTAKGMLRGPDVITVGGDGLAYVLDRTERVQRFSLSGEADAQSRHQGALDIAVAQDGGVWLVDGDKAERFKADFGQLDLQKTLSWDLDASDDVFGTRIGLDPGGSSVWILDIEHALLRRFDVATGAEGPPVDIGAVGVYPHWADMAVGRDGRVYVLDRIQGSVTVVGTDGTIAERFDLDRPSRRIAVLRSGKILLLTESGWVWIYDEQGSPLGVFDAARRDLNVESRPSDLAADAAGDVYVTDRAAGAVSRFAWNPDAPPVVPPELDSRCDVTTDKRLNPNEVLFGESITVTLEASGRCARRRLPPLEVMLVLDASGSMAGDRIELVRQAALDFAQALDLAKSRLAIVSFSQTGTVETPLTASESELWRAVRRIQPFGASRIDVGLATAHGEWRATRRQEPSVESVLILLSDGRSERTPSLTAADLIKRDGVRIFTIGTHRGTVETDLMKAIASREEDFFLADEPTFLFDVFDAIANQIASPLLFETARVVDRIAENMAYIEGSANRNGAWDPDARELTWDLVDVKEVGFELTYRVTPLDVGEWPTGEGASAEVRDGFGRPDRLAFPQPRVRVIAPTPTPSPTPLPPPPVYLPIAIKETCTPTENHTDVILAIDTSGSMEGEKLAAAIGAAQVFVDNLDLSEDQVALVAFDMDARLVLPFSSDLPRVRAAIDSLESREGTRIDLGLELAQREMNRPGARKAGNTPAIVLLTDGIQVGDRDRVEALADALCAAKVSLFAIGLGDAATRNDALLESVACKPEMAFRAPSPDALAGIYRQIAGEIPCDASQYWGKR